MTYHKSRAKIALFYGLTKGFNLFYLICVSKVQMAPLTSRHCTKKETALMM